MESASIPAPALLSSTAGVLSESPFQASATAPPRPSSSAVRFACGMPTTVTPFAKVTVGVTVTPSAPGVAEPMFPIVPAAPLTVGNPSPPIRQRTRFEAAAVAQNETPPALSS